MVVTILDTIVEQNKVCFPLFLKLFHFELLFKERYVFMHYVPIPNILARILSS